MTMADLAPPSPGTPQTEQPVGPGHTLGPLLQNVPPGLKANAELLLKAGWRADQVAEPLIRAGYRWGDAADPAATVAEHDADYGVAAVYEPSAYPPIAYPNSGQDINPDELAAFDRDARAGLAAMHIPY